MPCRPSNSPLTRPPLRRRSPGWVRALDRSQLHGLAGRLVNLYTEQSISVRQELLLDACLSELEYRHRSERRLTRRCWCQMCVPPFPATDMEASTD